MRNYLNKYFKIVNKYLAVLLQWVLLIKEHCIVIQDSLAIYEKRLKKKIPELLEKTLEEVLAITQAAEVYIKNLMVLEKKKVKKTKKEEEEVESDEDN